MSRAALILLLVGCSSEELVDVLGEAPEGALLAVWGPSADDVWIVGGQPEAGVVLRGSGEAFESMALPDDTPMLNWVHGTGANDVWVGGLSGTVLHWDGSAWTDLSVDMDEAIWGLYANDDDDVWFVGGTSRWGGDAGRVFHYTGDVLQAVDLPPELSDSTNVFKVHADGDRMWFVGAGGIAAYSEGGTLTAAATGFGDDLVTAHRGDSEHLMVVGGRGTGRVFEADGDRLTEVASTPAGLNGVISLDARTLVAGENGFMAFVDRSDGMVTPIETPTLNILHAVWVAPDDTLYAVGGNLGTADPFFHGTLISGPLTELP